MGKRLERDRLFYNLLSWSYGVVLRRPAVKRAAQMRLTKDSRFNADELSMAAACPRRLLEAVATHWRPRSVLDVGCGLGLAMDYLMSRGIECVGLEGSADAVAASPVSKAIRLVNLNHAVRLGRTFDVVWSYEVAEHIHPAFAATFVETLTAHGDKIVMSAAQPGQGGCGHLNEQPPSYWIELLARRGFTFDHETSDAWRLLPDDYAENIMVFTRGSLHPQ